jgi:hypothetical protein
MPAKRFPIRGGFYALTDRHWSQQDVLNLHARPAEVPGTKTELELVHFGLRPHVEIGTGAVRGMRNVEGKRFVVSGTQLYEISATGVAIPRGYIPGIGRVSMAHNRYGGGHQLVIDNGAARYVYNTVDLTFVKVTDPSFPGSFCAFFVDQFLGYVAPQGDEWGHSDLNDATDYNDLDTYAAEADPDRIIWAHVSHREVLIFGKKTIEPYVNSPVGDGVAPFQRAANTVIPYGLSAKYSVVDMDGATFFVDQYLQVRELRGYQTTRISNAGVEEALAECPPSAIARGYAFPIEWGPHKFYVLTIPGHVTFVFDVWTREWVRKSSRGMPTWRLADCMYWEGQWIGGDATTGRLYTLDWDYPWDGTEELEREFSPGILFADQRGIEVNEIEVLVTPGNPTVAVDSFPAQPTGPTLVLGGADGTAGVFYTHTYTATGGTPPYTFSFAPGASVDGFTITAAGVFSGTAPAAGDIEPELRVTDANGLWDEGTDEIAFAAPFWFFGPVFEDGVLGGSGAFYLKTTDPTDWGGAPIALPNGMATLGRISQSRGVLFFHPADATENAQVSRDGGITFEEADHPLHVASETNYGVYWNGDYHHFRHLRSADGLTWTAIPNLPLASGEIDSYFARDSDGAVLLAGTDGNIHVSLNNGATWTTRVSPYGGATFYPFATDGDRILGGAAGGLGVGWSDDLFATAATHVPDGGTACVYANDVWVGLGVGWVRTSPTAATFTNQQAATTVLYSSPLVDFDGDLWVFADADGAEALVYTSDDNGDTWTAGDTLYSTGGSLVWGGA